MDTFSKSFRNLKNLLFTDKMMMIGLLLIQKTAFFAQKEAHVDSVKFQGGMTSVIYKKQDSQADDMAILLAMNGQFSTGEQVKIAVAQPKSSPSNLPDLVPQTVQIAAEPRLEAPISAPKSTESTAKPMAQTAQKSVSKKAVGKPVATQKTASKKSSGKQKFAKPMTKKRFRWPSFSLPILGRDSARGTGCYRF